MLRSASKLCGIVLLVLAIGCTNESATEPVMMSGEHFSVEEVHSEQSGLCPDCGNMTTHVWGNVHKHGSPYGRYFITWTHGESPHPANFDFVLGGWGEDVPKEDRTRVSILYRNDEETRGFMVVDAPEGNLDTDDLASRNLGRDEVVDTPLADELFDILDIIFLTDERIPKIRTLPPRVSD